MEHKNTIFLIIIVVILLIGGFWWYNKKAKEDYADVELTVPDSVIMERPNFKADLAPRFDPHIDGGYIRGPMPPYGFRGAPESPLEDGSEFARKMGSELGRSIPSTSNYADREHYSDSPMEYNKLASPIPIPEIRKTSNSSKQTLEYTNPADLLPTPDMSYLTSDGSRDPSDPSTYVYDRYLFAKLKPRNIKNIGDSSIYIRGDLPIKPLNLGWFVPSSAPQIDLIKGSISQIADISTSIDLQDVSIENSQVEKRLQAKASDSKNLADILPWGNMWE